MRLWALAMLLSFPVLCFAQSEGVTPPQTDNGSGIRIFTGSGVVLKINRNENEVTVRRNTDPGHV